MKQTFFLLAISTMLLSNRINGQTPEQTLMTIDGRKISAEEFKRVYTKNNNITVESEQKSIENYLDLFINYKLKVIEAEKLGYDTVQSFTEEFNGFRDQLAKPYLQDKSLKEDLIKEAYERLKYDVKASHLLILVDENATPADTLAAYKRITELRSRIIAGEPFDEVAKANSEDRSAVENGGDLGYFTAFRMVYSFESAAFNTPVGKVSEPFRTRFGYHLVKVVEKRPNRGSIKVSHLMTRVPQEASMPEVNASREKIEQALAELKNGVSWNEVVQKYSENARTRANNGELGWLETGQAPDNFLDACYATESGKFTAVVETFGGFHIAFVHEKKSINSFEDSYEQLKAQVDKDDERKKSLEETAENALRKKYNYKEFPKNLSPIIQVLDSSIYDITWSSAKAIKLTDTLISVGEKNYTQYDYAQYLSALKRSHVSKRSFEAIVKENFADFGKKSLDEYAIGRLPIENEDYRYLIQEYHDGILLFNLTNDTVWKRAQQDTAGLEAFYANTEKYKWNERIDVTIYEYLNDSLSASLPKIAKNQAKKNLADSLVIKQICKSKPIDCVTILKKTYEKGHDAMCDKLPWEKGANIVLKEGSKNFFYYVNNIHPVEIKKLKEARGLYIADYQTYLEKQWIEKLRLKYPVVINTEVLESIKTQLK